MTAVDRECVLESITNQYLEKQEQFDDADRVNAGINIRHTERGLLPAAAGWKTVKHFRY